MTNLLDEGARSRIDASNPYPGLHPFQEEDEEFFFGRDDETTTLVRLIRRRVLTTCFGRSGLGKTSLLRAGVLPELRRRLYFPVIVRFDFAQTSGELGGQVLAQIRAEAERWKVDGPEPVEGETLWEFLHRGTFWDERNQLLEPVVLFDQFEEIFTLGARDARVPRLLRELIDTVENHIPSSIRARLAEEDYDLPFSASRQDYKVVLSLREDFLPHLEDIARQMPSLLENRFRLLAMTAEQGREAVLGPWQNREGEPVIVGEVADTILRNVAGSARRSGSRAAPPKLEELSIEPALLSLFCRELNERRAGKPVSKALVAKSGDVFGDFYRRCVTGRPPELRIFIEEELLTDRGFRRAEVLEDVERRTGIEKEDIRDLVDQRLFRIEERLGIPHIELIHDRLAEVVKDARDKRRARDEARQRIRTLRRRVAAVAAIAVVVIAVGALQANRAVEAAREAARADSLRAAQLRVEADSARDLALDLATSYEGVISELVESSDTLSEELAARIEVAGLTTARVVESLGERELSPPAEPIGLGDRGPEVFRILEWLRLRGCVDVLLTADFRGPAEDCVTRLQRAAELPPTGRVDAATFAMLVEPMRRAVTPADPSGHTFASLLTTHAEQHLAERPREVGGDNQGPWVRLYMRGREGVGYPWSVGFASYLLGQTADALGLPNPLGQSLSFEALADTLSVDREGLGGLVAGEALVGFRPRRGDIALRRAGSGEWIGGGVVVSVSETGFESIEPDSNEGGGGGSDAVLSWNRPFQGHDFVRMTGFERQVLWVDDRVGANRGERIALIGIGVGTTMTRSTSEAMGLLRDPDRDFDVVITDMGRPEGPLAGYALLDSMQTQGIGLPLIVYSTSSDLERRNQQVQARGGLGQVATSRGLVELLTGYFLSR